MRQKGLLMEAHSKTNDGMDWEAAERHLCSIEEAYEEFIALNLPGVNPWFGAGVVASARARFDAGERTRELYDDIMSLE